MKRSKVWRECVWKCCPDHRLIVFSTFCFRTVTSFLQLNLIVLKIYKKARCGAFIYKLQFMIFWAALVDRERPWAAKNGRSIKTQLLKWGTWQIVQYTENPLWIYKPRYKLQNSSWHSFKSPQAKESWFRVRSSGSRLWSTVSSLSDLQMKKG